VKNGTCQFCQKINIKSTGTGSLEQDTTGNPGVKKTKIVYPKLAGAYPEIKKP
jgi:hypothetical protein